MAKIPENILEDILSRIDIVELISGYIPLKKAGRNFKANCPFHHEKTPSFMVSADRQIYHCFGCGAGGNAFGFLMKYERLEFPEVVEMLAKKAGVILPEFNKEDQKAAGLVTQLYKINEAAVVFYQNSLNSAEASGIRSYFAKRSINPETIKTFKLGYAPNKWDTLINLLRSGGFALSLLEKAGLVLAKQGGGYYDRFRNRIIFPIFDIKSRPVGFGARVLDNTLPKYVNSPETLLYIKGRNLYGLNFSKDSIRETDSVVIVEGYLDFIIPFQAGLRNIVASLGTALTTEQVRLLKRYTNNVVMIYDADSAGELATLRSLDIFIEEEMSVKIVSLPKGADPDSFVCKNGIEAFKERIAQAKGLFEYKLGILKSRYDYREIEGKTKISCEILATIAKIKNAVLKSEYIKRIAQELDVKEEALLQEAGKIKQDKRYPQAGVINYQGERRPLNINPTERLLIKLMLEEEEAIRRIREELKPTDFQDERISRIVSIMFELIEQGKNIEPCNLMNYFDEQDISKLVCESMFSPQDLSADHKEKVIDDCIKRLKGQRLRLRRLELHEQIKAAQALGQEDRVSDLMEEFHCLIKEKAE